MERGDIVAARIKFLRTVHNLAISGGERPVINLDETWVNQNQYKVQLAGLIKKGKLESSFGKSEQAYCVSRRISKPGFIRESQQIFRSHPQMRGSNYHSEMNADSFKDLFVNRFLNYLEEGSIISMDKPAPILSLTQGI
jgi:hypothetical protein